MTRRSSSQQRLKDRLRVVLRAILGSALVLAIPAGAGSITAEELIQIPDIPTLSVAPSGKALVFQVVRADVSANNYHIEWMYRQTESSSPAVAIADGGTPIPLRYYGNLANGSFTPSPVLWGLNEEWIGFFRPDDRGVQLWRARLIGAPAEQITHFDGDVVSASWSADKQTVLLKVSNERTRIAKTLADEYDSGYRYDGRFIPYYSSKPVHFMEYLHPSAGAKAVQNTEELWTWNPQTGRVAPDRGAPPTDANGGEAQLDDGVRERELQVPSDAGHAAFTVPATGSPGINPERVIAWEGPQDAEPHLCMLAECRGRFRWLQWRMNRELIFARKEATGGALTAIYAMDMESQRVRRLLRTESEIAHCTISGDYAFCIESAAAIPPRVVKIDLESGQLAILDEPSAGISHKLPRPHLISVSGRGAQDTFAYVYLPEAPSGGAGRTPIVVVTYECREFMPGGTGNEYPIALLVQQGFAVLCFQSQIIDAHAAVSKTWNEYLHLDSSKERGLEILLESLKLAVSEAAERFQLDGGNVGITGLSHGADFTLYALPNWHNIRAAITSGGARGPSMYFLGGAYTQQWMHYWGRPSPYVDSLSRNEIYTSHFASRTTAPLLINASDQEFRLMLELYGALKEQGRTVEMYVYPDEAHIKSQPRHRLSVYQRNLEWLGRWLPARQVDYH